MFWGSYKDSLMNVVRVTGMSRVPFHATDGKCIPNIEPGTIYREPDCDKFGGRTGPRAEINVGRLLSCVLTLYTEWINQPFPPRWHGPRSVIVPALFCSGVKKQRGGLFRKTHTALCCQRRHTCSLVCSDIGAHWRWKWWREGARVEWHLCSFWIIMLLSELRLTTDENVGWMIYPPC